MPWQSKVAEILKRLSETSANYAQATINFAAERNLDKAFWRNLHDSLVPLTDAAALKEKTTELCRLWILKGPVVTGLDSRTFGRAVGMDALSKTLIKLGSIASPRSARSAIRSAHGKPPNVISERWRDYPLGEYLMWATFGKPDATPFGSMTGAQIMCRLGLSRDLLGSSLILLEYRLPKGIRPRIPTVADAYAGREWYYYFRPALRNDPHGWSMPWPECKRDPRMPEVVHEVITGSCLQSVTEMLK